MHEMNEKLTQIITIFNMLAELREDELEFKNFTRTSSKTCY